MNHDLVAPSLVAVVRLGTVLLTSGLTACTTHYTLPEFDALARTFWAKTIYLGEKASVYSPYDLVPTIEFANLLEEERAEVFALFGVESETPVLVYLSPNDGLGLDAEVIGDQVHVTGARTTLPGSFMGQAGGRVAQIEVAAPAILQLENGRSLSQFLGASTYRETIRHEFTHVAVNLLGLGGPDWLREGMAHYVESVSVEDGRFVLDPAPVRLRIAAILLPGIRDLDPVLEWKQSIPPVEQDGNMRAIAFTLVTFLIERERAPSLREGYERIAAYRPEQIRALQPEWSAWLASLAPPPE